MPVAITQENIKFNGTLEGAYVLKEVGSGPTLVKTLIPVASLNTASEDKLVQFINKRGGANPMAAGGTSGTLAVNYGPATTTASPTGLAALATATAGTNTIEFQTTVTGATATGFENGTPAKSGYQTVNLNPLTTPATATGLVAGTLTVKIKVDGAVKSITLAVAPVAFSDLITDINTELDGSAVAVLADGVITITSATTGVTSEVVISEDNIFSTLANYVSTGVSTKGTLPTPGPSYSANCMVDGNIMRTIRFTGDQAQTITTLLSQMNTDLAGVATAALTDGKIVITSDTVGDRSSVNLFDTGRLVGRLAGFKSIKGVPGRSIGVYNASVRIDGVTYPISVQGSEAQTFGALISEIADDVAPIVPTLVNGSIVFTSPTTGANSIAMNVVGEDALFRQVAGFAGFTRLDGAVDLVDELKKVKFGGTTMYEQYHVIELHTTPQASHINPGTSPAIYFDGTNWKFLSSDAIVNA